MFDMLSCLAKKIVATRQGTSFLDECALSGQKTLTYALLQRDKGLPESDRKKRARSALLCP